MYKQDDDVREELLNHKYFRRLIHLLDEHPYKNDVLMLHASLIVRGGSILAMGVNQPQPNQFALSYALHVGWQTHSEFNAVNQIRRKINLRGSVMYNARINRSGEILMCKPCLACCEMMHNYGFKRAVYTTKNGFDTFKMSEYALENVA